MEPIDEREEGESKSDEQGRERRRVEGVNPKKHERPYNPFRKHPNLINEPSRCPIFLLRSRAGDISEGRKSVSERNLMGETIEKPDVPVLLDGMAEVLFLALQRGNSRSIPKKDPWIFYNPYIGATGPSKKQIHRFISDLIVDHKVVAECGVMATAYLDRYLALVEGARIHMKNIFPLVTTAIILATKVYEDDSVFNEDFLPTVSFFSSKDLSEMEKLFLSQLDFRVNIKASVYAQYFFELCQLSPEVHSEKVPAPANSTPRMANARRTKSMATIFSQPRVVRNREKQPDFSAPYPKMSDQQRQSFSDPEVLNAQVQNARQEVAYWRRRYDELKGDLLEIGVLTATDPIFDFVSPTCVSLPDSPTEHVTRKRTLSGVKVKPSHSQELLTHNGGGGSPAIPLNTSVFKTEVIHNGRQEESQPSMVVSVHDANLPVRRSRAATGPSRHVSKSSPRGSPRGQLQKEALLAATYYRVLPQSPTVQLTKDLEGMALSDSDPSDMREESPTSPTSPDESPESPQSPPFSLKSSSDGTPRQLSWKPHQGYSPPYPSNSSPIQTHYQQPISQLQTSTSASSGLYAPGGAPMSLDVYGSSQTSPRRVHQQTQGQQRDQSQTQQYVTFTTSAPMSPVSPPTQLNSQQYISQQSPAFQQQYQYRTTGVIPPAIFDPTQTQMQPQDHANQSSQPAYDQLQLQQQQQFAFQPQQPVYQAQQTQTMYPAQYPQTQQQPQQSVYTMTQRIQQVGSQQTEKYAPQTYHQQYNPQNQFPQPQFQQQFGQSQSPQVYQPAWYGQGQPNGQQNPQYQQQQQPAANRLPLSPDTEEDNYTLWPEIIFPLDNDPLGLAETTGLDDWM